MATKAEIADVLEKAADLYESERIKWCRGTWGGVLPGKGMITACASSALGMAAGLEDPYGARFLEPRLALGITRPMDSPAADLYVDVRRHVDAALNAPLPTWNDEEEVLTLPYDEVTLFDDKRYYLLPRHRVFPLRTKEQVVDLFKGLAKDLRNEE